MFLFRCLLLLTLSPDQMCNPSGSLISSSSLSPGLGNGRTIVAAVLMFVMVVYSWYVIFLFHSHWHLVSSYNRTCTNGHLSTMATLLCPGGQSIGWLLFNLSSTATATKARPQLPKYPLDNGQFFSDWRKVKNGHDIWSVWRRVDD